MEAGLCPVNLALEIAIVTVFLFYNAIEHLAVRAKFITATGQITIGCPGIVRTGHSLAGSIDEVIISVDPVQTGLLPIHLTVHIVVDAIIHLRQSIYHLTVKAKGIGIAGQIAMGFPSIVALSTNCRTIVGEEIIISVNLMQAHLMDAIYNVVQFIIKRVESVAFQFSGNTILTKVIPLTDIVKFLIIHKGIAGYGMAVTEVIPFPVNLLPLTDIVRRTVVISPAGNNINPDAGLQLTIGFEFISNAAKLPGTANCSQCCGIKVVPVAVNRLPPAFQDTLLSIAIYAFLVITEHTGILCLAHIDTMVIEVVVIAVRFLDAASQSYAFPVVSKAAFLCIPTILQSIYKRIRIFKFFVYIAEVCASFLGILGIHKGLQTKNLLILGFLCKGIQSTCTEINSVTDLTCMGHLQATVGVIGSIILGCQFDAAHQTKGIGCCRINGCSLVNPSKFHGQGIGILIKLCVDQFKVFSNDLQFTVVHIHIGIKVENRSNLS